MLDAGLEEGVTAPSVVKWIEDEEAEEAEPARLDRILGSSPGEESGLALMEGGTLSSEGA